MGKLKAATQSSQMKVMRRMKMSIAKPSVGAAAEITMRMNSGLDVMCVRGGTMENV